MNFIEKLFGSKKQLDKPEFEFEAHKADGFNKLGVMDLTIDNTFLYSRSSNGSIKTWKLSDMNLVKSFEKPENVKDAVANFIIKDGLLFSAYVDRVKVGFISAVAGPNNILIYDGNGNILLRLSHEKFNDEPGYERLEYIFINGSYIYGIFNSEWAIGSDTPGFDYIRITVWNNRGQLVKNYKFAECPPSTFTNDGNFIYALNQSQTGSPFGLHIFEYRGSEISENQVITSIKPESSMIKFGGSMYKYDKLLVDDSNIYHLSNRKIKCFDKNNFKLIWEMDVKFSQLSSACLRNAYICFSGDCQVKILSKQDGRILKEIQTDPKINCITADEERIYCGLTDGSIRVFSLP